MNTQMFLEEDALVESTKRAYQDNAGGYSLYADDIADDILTRDDLFAFLKPHNGSRFNENDTATWNSLVTAVQVLHDREGRVSIADIGCGEGMWLLRLAAQFPYVQGVGIDIVPNFISLANRRSLALGLHNRVKFKTGDARRLELADKSSDLVIALHDVLNHIPDPWKALRELHRVSKNKVFVSVHSTHGTKTCYVSGMKGINDFLQCDDTLRFTDSEGRQQTMFSHLFTAREIAEMVSMHGTVMDVFGVDLLDSRFVVTSGTSTPETLIKLEDTFRRDEQMINFYQHIIVVSHAHNGGCEA